MSKPVLTYGVDIGTHSVKIVKRFRGATMGEIVYLEPPSDGYCPFAIPSVVRLENGSVHVGGEALSNTGGELYRSLKVPYIQKLTAGQHSLDGVPVELLHAALIAHVFQAILNDAGQSEIRINCPIPLRDNPQAATDSTSATIQKSFEKLLHTAWQMANGAWRNGINLKELQECYRTASEMPVPGVGDSQRRIFVLPESIAPIVSFINDPHFRPGVYLPVDMGAGTTEISVTRIAGQGSLSVQNFFDRTLMIGCDNLDYAQSLPAAESKAERHRLLMTLWKNSRELYHASRLKLSKAERIVWSQRLELLLIGGAAKANVIHKLFFKYRPVVEQVELKHFEVTRHYPASLDYSSKPSSLDYSSEEVRTDFGSFLCVADGLSYEFPFWPPWYKQNQLPSGPQPDPKDKLPPYWYIGGSRPC